MQIVRLDLINIHLFYSISRLACRRQYAAPLILLAQTRQADRDKAHSEADALHREEIAYQMQKEQGLALDQSKQLLRLLEDNNKLTASIQQLSERIELLTVEIHGKITTA